MLVGITTKNVSKLRTYGIQASPQAQTSTSIILLCSMLTFSRESFQELLALAKNAFIAEEEAKITIKMVDESKDDGEWRQVAQKHKRPLTSVVTEAGVKEQLERDILEFCKSEEWYISRGVPWRRGFLLHGKPTLNLSLTSS